MTGLTEPSASVPTQTCSPQRWSEECVIWRKVSRPRVKAWQDGGAAEQSGDALGADLGGSGGKTWQEWAFSSAAAEDYVSGTWGLPLGRGEPRKACGQRRKATVLGQLSRCWPAERAAKEAGSSGG